MASGAELGRGRINRGRREGCQRGAVLEAQGENGDDWPGNIGMTLRRLTGGDEKAAERCWP